MEWSFWEQDLFQKQYDVVIIGGGFSGLSTAYYLASQNPEMSIAILEKEVFHRKASTRNAGMACISSLSELIRDADSVGWGAVLNLIENRWKGLELMRDLFSHDDIHYSDVPAGEIFFQGQHFGADSYLNRMDEANDSLKDIVGRPYFKMGGAHLPLPSGAQFVSHAWEGQLHPARLCQAWIRKCKELGVDIWEGLECQNANPTSEGYQVKTKGPAFSARKILWATNGSISDVYPELDVSPVINHVWVFSKETPLQWVGNIHAEAGYVYARNVGNQLLIGGGRHNQAHQGKDLSDNGAEVFPYLLDFADRFLWDGKRIAEAKPVAYWAGYLGMGSEKNPILKEVREGEFIIARLSGMGVALSTYLGREMAKRISKS